jgi:hypothetical protein
MAASLDDILTTQKNGVQAVNALVEALNEFKDLYRSFVGTETTNTLTTTSGALIKTGSGRVVNFAVSGTPTGVGYLYDASSVAAAIGNSPTDIICEIPDTNGIYQANLFFHDGLVVVCGSGMQVNITYS